MPADPAKREPKMPDVGKLAEWLNGYDGIVSMEIEGESPTRLRVEFATEERAAQFISTVHSSMASRFRWWGTAPL